jgi:RNA polymerase sigma-70 factor (ECF subfamily)
MDGDLYIKDLVRGDENAFRAVFEAYHTRLCYFASRLLAGREGAEDVVQEAFVKLWRKRACFAEESSVKAFLYITVRNHCLNLNKHDKVKKKYDDLMQSRPQPSMVNNDLIEAEVIETVYQALQKLPAGCRSIMELSYFEGMKNSAVAEQLRISVNTVKSQKVRALHLLRILLKGTSLLVLLNFLL